MNDDIYLISYLIPGGSVPLGTVSAGNHTIALIIAKGKWFGYGNSLVANKILTN